MALTFSLAIGSDQPDQTLLIQPDWWRHEKIDKVVAVKWVASEDSPGYTDYSAEIPVEYARKLHTYFRRAGRAMIAYNRRCLESSLRDSDEHAAARAEEYRRYTRELEEKMDQLDSAFGRNGHKVSFVRLQLEEWQSGY